MERSSKQSALLIRTEPLSVATFGAYPDQPTLSDEAFQKTLQVVLEDGHRQLRVPAGAYNLSQGLNITADDIEFICPNGVATIYQTSYGKNVARITGKRCRVRNMDLRNPVTKTRITNGNITQRYLGEFRRTEASALVLQGPDPLIENIVTRNFIAGIRWIGGLERYYEAAVYGASMTTTTLKLNTPQQRGADYWVGARFLARGTTGGNWTSVVLVTAYDTGTNVITWDPPTAVPTGDVWLYLVKDPSEGGVVNNHRSYGEDFGRIFGYVKDIELAGVHFTDNITKTQGAPPHAIYGTGSIDGVDDTVDTEPDLTPDMPAAENVVVTGSLLTVNSPEHMAYKLRNARRLVLWNEAVSIGSRGCFYTEMVESVSGRSRIINAKTTSGSNRPSAFEFYDTKYVDWDAHMDMDPTHVWSGSASSVPAVAVGNPIGRGRTPVNVNIGVSGVFRGDATTQIGLLIANTSGYPNIGTVNLRKGNLRAENATPIPITLARLFNVDRATIGPDIDIINVDPATGLTVTAQGRVTFDVGCKAALLDYDSRRTNGRLLVTDEGLATVTTTNLVRDRATEGSSNLLSNPLFDWPAGSPVAILASNTIYDVATGWKTWRGALAATISKQTGFAGTESCLRVQRDSGNASTQSIFLAFELASSLVRQLEGKEVTFIFDARAGANLSTSLSQIRTFFRTGTGVGETLITSGASVGTYTTGPAQTANVNVTLDPTGRFYNVRHVLPAGIGNACLCIQMAPVGTAGAADYFEISPAALIAGASDKPFSAFAQ